MKATSVNGTDVPSQRVPAPGRVPPWLFLLAGTVVLMFTANGIMIRLSSLDHRDLVRDDYYDASLDQDGAIKRRELADRSDMGISFFRDAQRIRVEAGSAAAGYRCRAVFYRPDNGGGDKAVDLGSARVFPGGRAVWNAEAPKLRAGNWSVLLHWEEGGKTVMEKPYRIYAEP